MGGNTANVAPTFHKRGSSRANQAVSIIFRCRSPEGCSVTNTTHRIPRPELEMLPGAGIRSVSMSSIKGLLRFYAVAPANRILFGAGA